jgi:hypothetical protein
MDTAPKMIVDMANTSPETESAVTNGMADLNVQVEPHTQYHFATDVSTWVHFIWDQRSWIVLLGTPAAIYLKKWLELLAQEHFGKRKELYSATRRVLGKSIEPLTKFVKIVLDAQKGSRDGEISVAIIVDGDRLCFRLPTCDEADATTLVARIVTSPAKISNAVENIKSAMTGNQRLLVKIEEAGFVVQWMSNSENCLYAQRFNDDGSTNGAKYRVQ